MVSSFSGTDVVFGLVFVDSNSIKLNTDLCRRERFRCWIRIEANTVRDIAGNLADPTGPGLSDTSATPDELFRDIVPPTVIGFNLDMEQRRIGFTFDEVVDVSSLNERMVSISDVGQNTSYQLQGGNRLTNTNGLTVEYSLLDSDIQELKQRKQSPVGFYSSDVALDVTTSYVMIEPDDQVESTRFGLLEEFFIVDMDENPVRSRFDDISTVVANAYVADSFDPEISSSPKPSIGLR
jgi:hypothetical protein